MRLITKEECVEKILKAEADLKIYQKEKAPPEKKDRAKAMKILWERIGFHIDNGEIITMDNESRIHWVQDVSRHN